MSQLHELLGVASAYSANWNEVHEPNETGLNLSSLGGVFLNFECSRNLKMLKLGDARHKFTRILSGL